MPPSWLAFFERPFPSANMALVRGERPVLIDTGYGSDFAETERLLRAAGCGPERLSLIVTQVGFEVDASWHAPVLQQHAATPYEVLTSQKQATSLGHP